MTTTTSAATLRPAWSRDEGAARVRALFATAFPDAPDGVWSAPGRVNLIGEHTDYNGGLCLPIALPHRTFVALRARDDETIRLVSAQEASSVVAVSLSSVAPGALSGWAAYVAGVAWALRQAGFVVHGFDAAVDSCVPYGAGLSSSAALESAFAVALDEVFRLGLASDDAGRARLAAACVRAENEIAGAPTGGLDQASSLRCHAGHALLLDCLDGSVEQVPFDLAAAGLALLVVDTKAEHSHATGGYGARRATCEEAAESVVFASVLIAVPMEFCRFAAVALMSAPISKESVAEPLVPGARAVSVICSCVPSGSFRVMLTLSPGTGWPVTEMAKAAFVPAGAGVWAETEMPVPVAEMSPSLQP